MAPRAPRPLTPPAPFQGADRRWYVVVPVLGPDGERRVGYLSARTRRGALVRLSEWRPLPGEPPLTAHTHLRGRGQGPGRGRSKVKRRSPRLGVLTVVAIGVMVMAGEVVVAHRADAHSSAPAVSQPQTNLLSTAPITRYLATRNENVTMALYDANNGRTYLYRPNVTETTASIIKVDILATLLHQGEQSQQPLDQGTAEVATTMIENSNDDSANTLWYQVGAAEGVSAFDNDVGLTQTTPATEWGLTMTSAADQVKMVRTVAYPSQLLDQASQSYELGLMENVESDQRWGISAGVPANATVAIKDGWDPLNNNSEWQVNSIGWVHGDGRNYVLAVLTVGEPTEQDGINTIQGVSPIVWRELAPTPGANH